jgi:polar amino acid transport system substrate-binding protein
MHSASQSAETGHVLHISTAFGPPISTIDKHGFFDLLIQEACTRIGYQVEIDHPQAGRALMLANAGINDGDGPRVDTLDNLSGYPNLIRVEEKLMNIDFVAFTVDPSLQIHGWNSLYGHDVAIVTGWKILERRLSNLSNLVKVKDVLHALLLLKNKRTDVVILDRYSGLETANRLGFTNIRVNGPPLYSRSMYLYLNKRNAEVARKLAMALRTMKNDGTYQHIYDETLGHVKTHQ